MSILHTSSERRRATWVPGADKSRQDSPRPKVLHFIALIRALDTSQTFIIHLASTQQKKNAYCHAVVVLYLYVPALYSVLRFLCCWSRAPVGTPEWIVG